jgi:hypothetical protein
MNTGTNLRHASGRLGCMDMLHMMVASLLQPTQRAHKLHPVACRCYSTADCASFLETCPFSDDTKKGKSLAGCLPDKSDFNKAACSADAKGKVTSADGKEVPLAANVTCFQSEKLTCDIYRNATGHSFITASCKALAKRSSSAQVPASLWQCCLLLGMLVSDCVGCRCDWWVRLKRHWLGLKV